jgi:hypothetical protein
MKFIETKKFTELITKLLNDDGYKELQEFLIKNPKAGKVIKNTGGLRKLRWAIEGKGKRGGIRTLYYYADMHSIFFMIYAYPKNVADNITKQQSKMFKTLIDNIKMELEKNG